MGIGNAMAKAQTVESAPRPSALQATDFFLTAGSLVGFYLLHIAQEPLLALGAFGFAFALTLLAPSLLTQRWFFFSALIFAATLTVSKHLPFVSEWPLDLFFVSMAIWMSLRIFRLPPQEVNWSLRFTRRQLGSVAAIAFPSIAVLSTYYVTHPEVADLFPLPQVPSWSLPPLLVSVAIINGLREELCYRVLLQGAAEAGGARSIAALLGSAVAFGALHFHFGFPSGWLGTGLCTLFGLMIGLQYALYRSATLCWLTHTLVDAAMFGAILATRTR